MAVLGLWAAFAWACAPFRSSPDDGDASTEASVTPGTDAGADAPADGTASCLSPGCLLFSDDFERGEVKGPWDLVVGVPVLAPGQGGKHLQANGGGVNASAPAYVRKFLPNTGGVAIELGLVAGITAGDFGTSNRDFCDLLTIELDEIPLAFLYIDRRNVNAWVWADATRRDGAGAFVSATLGGPGFPRVRLAATWRNGQTIMTGDVGGAQITAAPVPFESARENARLSVRVGVECSGKSAAVEVLANDVVVKAL